MSARTTTLDIVQLQKQLTIREHLGQTQFFLTREREKCKALSVNPKQIQDRDFFVRQ